MKVSSVYFSAAVIAIGALPCLSQTVVMAPSALPAAITAGSPTTLTISALITSTSPQLIASSVTLLQVDQHGNNASVIGTLHDDGVNGDFFAGDSIFSGKVTLQQSSPGQLYVQVSAAFKGTLRRTLSPIISIPVTAPGVPNAPRPSTTLTTVDPQTGEIVVCNELLVTFQPGASQQDITSAILSVGGTLVGMLAHLGVYQVTIPSCDGASLSAARATLSATLVVTSVETSGIGSLTQLTGSPNDPYYVSGKQWGLATIKASQAWTSANSIAAVSGGATVAIIDTGINAAHEDLLGQVTSGVNWCAAVDTTGNTCTAIGTSTGDDYGHGTMVAGIAAAMTNNSLGVASPAYKARIIAEKVNFPGSGSITVDGVANAIGDAVSRGARVINLSLGFGIAYHTVNLAVIDAVAKGVIVVASAGNNGSSAYLFPAAFGDVIAVGASDQNNLRSAWYSSGTTPCVASEPSSNYGSWVTLYAPGSQIFGLLYSQTSGPNAYGYFGAGPGVSVSCTGDGTSFAAPFVTGAASLMLAVNPSLSPSQIKSILMSTATLTGNLDPDGNPVAILNMASAVSESVTPPPATAVFQFTGVVTSVSDSTGTLSGKVFVSNPVSGQFSYTLLPPNGGGTYVFPGRPSGVVVTVAGSSGPLIFTNDFNASNLTVLVEHDVPIGSIFLDLFEVFGEGSSTTWPPGILVVGTPAIQLALIDSIQPPRLLSSTALPTWLNLSNADDVVPGSYGDSAVSAGTFLFGYTIQFKLTSLVRSQ